MTSTRPFLKIVVAWHPDFLEGQVMARSLYEHYRRDLFDNVAGGTGLPVLYRSTPALATGLPMAIDLSDSETSAVFLLVDDHLLEDAEWLAWSMSLIEEVEAKGLSARVFPVAISSLATKASIGAQAIRWDKWTDLTPEHRLTRLMSDLSYQICRMLRLYLGKLSKPLDDDEELLQYLQKVEIFLSHSKHDADGERLATEIRSHLQSFSDFETFFDVINIPAGLQFDKVMLLKVRVSAVVAIHTDSYSSREWCRREIIEAKRGNAPLVIVDCIQDRDERGFPYLGNVPIIRMDPVLADRFDVVLLRLLDEVMKAFLWDCQLSLYGAKKAADTVFVPRPPELIMLSNLDLTSGGVALVYPEPPIGAEEEELFHAIAPGVELLSMSEWRARSGI